MIEQIMWLNMAQMLVATALVAPTSVPLHMVTDDIERKLGRLVL